MGALDVPKVVHGRQAWRLLTCMWLHAGVVHLLINMLCLLFIGVRLEQEFGFVRVGLTAATVLLFRGYDANEHCSWCRYLSCVPTRRWRCDSSPTVCTATQREDTLTLLCEGSGRNRTYLIAGASKDRINDLCNQLCT